MIGGRLDNPMDILRFRSVCSPFRSSIPPLRRNTSRVAFQVPCPTSEAVFPRPSAAVFLCWSTVYALETPEGAAASGPARWLLKLEELELGRVRILSLFSQGRMAFLPREFPKVLDFLQFRMVEICREYTLDYDSRTRGLVHVEGIRKVLMHPDCVGSDLDRCSVYFIDEYGQLAYWRYGDENWSHLDHPEDFEFDDIAVYNGKVCAVDYFGLVWEINESFGLQPFPTSIYGSNSNHHPDDDGKYLVVSSGDLYVVDTYYRDGANESHPFYTVNTSMDYFRVFRWDRQRRRWEEVRSLGNSAFFLCKHRSFALPPCELGGCHGNCIYYAEEADSIFSMIDVKVFSLADRSIKCLDFSDSILGMMNTSRLK